MKNKNLNVGIAIGLGALIGAIIGKQIGKQISPDFWWVGILVGAIIGGVISYLTYDLKQIIEAIPKAWDKTIKYLKPIKNHKTRAEKIIIKRKLFYSLVSFSNFITCFTYMVLFASILKAVFPNDGEKYTIYSSINSNLSWFYSLVVLAVVASILYFFMTGRNFFRGNRWKIEKENFLFQIRNINVIVIPFTAAYYLCKGVIYVVPRMPKAIMFAFQFMWNFLKQLLIQVHSEKRLLCLLGGFTFSAIGILFDSPIIFALVGFVAGYLYAKYFAGRILQILQPKVV